MKWAQIKQRLFGNPYECEAVKVMLLAKQTESLRRTSVLCTLESIHKVMEKRANTLAQQGENPTISATEFAEIYRTTSAAATLDMDRVIAISDEEESIEDVAHLRAISMLMRKANVPYTQITLVGQKRIAFNRLHGLLPGDPVRVEREINRVNPYFQLKTN